MKSVVIILVPKLCPYLMSGLVPDCPVDKVK